MARSINTNNKIVNNQFYSTIIAEYNEIFKRDGKVNKGKFFLENVKPRIGNINQATWYRFIQKFQTTAELLHPKPAIVAIENTDKQIAKQEGRILQGFADNATATRNLIANMLNIGADAAKEISENLDSMSPEKRVDLALKAMRAQDSRIFAVAAVKKDRREEKAFQASFDDAAYQQDDIIDGEVA